MAKPANTTFLNRRATILGLSAMLFASAVTLPSAAPIGDADQLSELFTLIRSLPPMKQVFIREQLYRMSDGEPNVFKGTASYSYEEWLAEWEPWEIDIVLRGFKPIV